MDSNKENAGQIPTDSIARGREKNEPSTNAQPKFITEKIKLDERKTAWSFDWQACVKDHPYLTLGLAAGAGVLLVSLLKPQPTAKKRLVKTLSNNLAGVSSHLERGVGSLAEQPARIGTSVKAAATTMAGKALKTYLKRRLINTLTPGRKRRMFF